MSWKSPPAMLFSAMLAVAVADSSVLPAQGIPQSVLAAQRDMERAAGGAIEVRHSPATGAAAFVRTRERRRIPLPMSGFSRAEDRARTFVSAYGRAFGLPTAGAAEVVRVEGPDELGMEHVRMRQTYRGVPVTGAELLVHLRGAQVVAANGKTLPLAEDVGTSPAISAADAAARIGEALAETLGPGEAALSRPRLELFNRGLIAGGRTATRLAWFVEAAQPGRREFVWIDADSGELLLHFNQLPDALQRAIYDAADTADIPGTLVRSEGDPPTGDQAVDKVYDFTGDTYDYYLNQHARDSYDGAGATMTATAHSCISFCGCPCFNAYWIATQTVFGLLLTDDIVAHEWTHGVTQYSADLIYFMQSGALNEAYSDIFGETVDLGNGAGADTPATRWWISEDLFGGAAFGIRNMMDPTVRDDPGKTSDPQFECNDGSVDAGGVHTNSGVPNHAYALMVDGGSYNEVSVNGIGLLKAGKIAYRALTQYLVSTSDFHDNYDALQQACTDLIGTAGIGADDCEEVKRALDAVEMDAPWPCTCGNGVIDDPAEECDDGNKLDSDGCSSTCQRETIAFSIDHYKCYQGRDLKNPPFVKRTAETTDQIATETLDVRKVKYVCIPADKNGEGIKDAAAYLTCYQVKGKTLDPRPAVLVSTQFQPSQFALKRPRLLCTPSTLAALP